MKKEVKKAGKKTELETFRDDIIRSFGVVAEHLEGKLDLVLEQYGDMNAKIDLLGKRINVLDQQLDSVAAQVGGLTNDMIIIKEQLQNLNSNLKRRMDVEEFEALERRVTELEKRAVAKK